MPSPSSPPAEPIVVSSNAGPHALYDTEWLLPTGHGGFAMGSGLGAPRRKYHTLLNAAATPPVDRVATISHLEEVLTLDPDTPSAAAIPLGARRTPGGQITDGVVPTLARFEKTATTARWCFESPEATVVREMRVGWRSNTATVRYTITTRRPARLDVTPWPAVRDFHDVRGNDADQPESRPSDRSCDFSAGGHTVRVASDAMRFTPHEPRHCELFYDLEASRRLPDTEHLLATGSFTLDLEPECKAVVHVGVSLLPAEPDLSLLETDERGEHGRVVVEHAVEREPALAGLEPLVRAADDFLVRRVVDGEPLMSVLAGYPWFADWGRDTMIALPGLMLTTGRFDDARGCLETFARHTSEGMIPNRFDDYGGPPHYNTIDASLWFLHAATEYRRLADDAAGFDAVMRDACVAIIEGYRAGTRYGIAMDPDDSLIAGGDETTQLTWMDAKRDGMVFTPRHGKAVEIQALWRHGLVRVAEAIEASDAAHAAEYRALAMRVGESLVDRFDDPDTGGLHDCLRRDASGAWAPTREIRPNQIFAASLEHSGLDAPRRAGVVRVVREHLLTPMGLRTLAPSDPGYQARFEGDMIRRDRAYHNGTVWPWLIGHYAEAALRAGEFSRAARDEAAAAISPLIESMGEGCLGQICEVCDAEEPRRQEGCTAQAWSVAEVLRIAAIVRSE